jgi:hypothetical protein
MNTDLLLATAAAIELEPESFDLGTWGRADPATICGSVGCVAGQVTAIVDQQSWLAWIDKDRSTMNRHPMSIATVALDIGLPEADALFTSAVWWEEALTKLGLTDSLDEGGGLNGLDKVKPKEAALVLRALAAGELDLGVENPRRCECRYCTMERDRQAGLAS